MIIVVMGVCSCGKTLIGEMLADELGLAFYDADDFHSAASVEKMNSGIALDDNDRLPWLRAMAKEMPRWKSSGGAVLACSALKESYRQLLKGTGDVCFVYLKGSRDLIVERMRGRKAQYMPLSLIDSQFATLEEPVDAVVADIAKRPDEIVRYIIEQLKKKTVD
jgi:carbohydrate kinase (thermoresistant glucokinase family)